ncbi:hypothetical protein [Marinitoga sp. 1155]|nr:hypothetical protein [Marinitoga sp. 1155]
MIDVQVIENVKTTTRMLKKGKITADKKQRKYSKKQQKKMKKGYWN